MEQMIDTFVKQLMSLRQQAAEEEVPETDEEVRCRRRGSHALDR